MLTLSGVGTADGAAPREFLVRPGGVFTAVARGFAPRAAVTERLDATRTVRHLRADVHGTVRIRVRAPRTLARHRLVFVGRSAAVRRYPAPPRAPRRGDQQILHAEVPRVVTVPFRVSRKAPVRPGTAGVAGLNANRDADRTPTAEAGARPASTGLDVRAALVLAASLVLAGAGVSSVARRVRH